MALIKVTERYKKGRLLAHSLAGLSSGRRGARRWRRREGSPILSAHKKGPPFSARYAPFSLIAAAVFWMSRPTHRGTDEQMLEICSLTYELLYLIDLIPPYECEVTGYDHDRDFYPCLSKARRPVTALNCQSQHF